MLRYEILFVLVLFLLQNCETMSQEIISIKLSEETRGYQRYITVDSNEVSILENGKETKMKVSRESWNKINLLLKKIEIEKLSNYKSTEKKRASDGALHSFLEINSKDKIYTSTTFDDKNPPKELSEIVKELRKLVPKD